MQHVGYLFGAVAAFVAIFLIASPERFFKRQSKSKKLVGPSYWGNYDHVEIGAELKSEDGNKNHGYFESIVYPSKEQSLAGSDTYARGRGVKE